MNENWQGSVLEVKVSFLEGYLIQQFDSNQDQVVETCRRISKNNYSCHSVPKVESSMNYVQHDELIDHRTIYQQLHVSLETESNNERQFEGPILTNDSRSLELDNKRTLVKLPRQDTNQLLNSRACKLAYVTYVN